MACLVLDSSTQDQLVNLTRLVKLHVVSGKIPHFTNCLIFYGRLYLVYPEIFHKYTASLNLYSNFYRSFTFPREYS